jgi:hypothetical protein
MIKKLKKDQKSQGKIILNLRSIGSKIAVLSNEIRAIERGRLLLP